MSFWGGGGGDAGFLWMLEEGEGIGHVWGGRVLGSVALGGRSWFSPTF